MASIKARLVLLWLPRREKPERWLPAIRSSRLALALRQYLALQMVQDGTGREMLWPFLSQSLQAPKGLSYCVLRVLGWHRQP